jgi:hypothetical protein
VCGTLFCGCFEQRVRSKSRCPPSSPVLYHSCCTETLFTRNPNKPPGMEPPKLDIKMDAKKMVYIRNAVIKEASSPAELMELFNLGNVERHTGKNKT